MTTRPRRAAPKISAASLAFVGLLVGLLAGCGSAAPSELPVEDDAAALARLQFSCGRDPFPLAALSGPIGVERADTALAEALRSLLTTPPVPGRPNLPVTGYRLLVESKTSAEFAAVSDQFDTGLAYVRLVLGSAGWSVEEFGDCRPQAVFEGLNSATWQLAPDVPFPNRLSARFTALVSEMTCTSGRTADGRVLPPAIVSSPSEVLVIFAVRPPPPSPGGLEACPRPRPTRVEVTLPVALGNRPLLDGGVNPPADPHPAIAPIDIDRIH